MIWECRFIQESRINDTGVQNDMGVQIYTGVQNDVGVNKNSLDVSGNDIGVQNDIRVQKVRECRMVWE